MSYTLERAIRVDRVIFKDKAIVVAMPRTPSKKPLPSVENEVKQLENVLSKASIDVIVMQHPMTRIVLFELLKQSIIHFIYQGNSADDLSQSCFLLDDRSLTVSNIISLNSALVKFAYLSPCHTSST